MTAFAKYQPVYAEHGIATFPVTATRTPAVRNYARMGLPASAELATRFTKSPALGFICGKRSGITSLDCDTRDERVLADALDKHGKTPIVARTGSGNFQAWYKHNGERRHIRPYHGRPIDILGGGYVVAPPSRVEKGKYKFLQGSLDDLDRLPVMQNAPFVAKPEGAKQGNRNNQLWRHCMRNAHHVDSFDDLLDVARTFNDDCLPPMEDTEVMSVATSAWRITERGQNRFGQYGAWFPLDEANFMLDSANQDAALLLMFMRAHQGPDATFMCANGLADRFGWRRQRLAEARSRLIELGYLVPIRQAGRGNPARFRWARRGQ